jgi:hypothetical protein
MIRFFAPSDSHTFTNLSTSVSGLLFNSQHKLLLTFPAALSLPKCIPSESWARSSLHCRHTSITKNTSNVFLEGGNVLTNGTPPSLRNVTRCGEGTSVQSHVYPTVPNPPRGTWCVLEMKSFLKPVPSSPQMLETIIYSGFTVRCSDAPSYPNMATYICNVAYMPIAKLWVCKQPPLLGNSRKHTRTQQYNNGVMQPVSKQGFSKHVPAKTNTCATTR